MKNSDVIVFDMDGVLMDVTDSYRESIVRTVRHFTGTAVSRERIQDYKNQGGWNNDWALSQRLAADLGVDVPYEEVANYFVSIFLDEGLIHRERPIPASGLLERLAGKYELAIFTGRSRKEATISLAREGWLGHFHLVASDDVENEKPAPDGLLQIAALKPGKQLLYIGDTVDDARSGKAAGVPFVGIASPTSPKRAELVAALESEGAVAVLNDVNELESLL
ncbi:MAG TPA: HAD-IA family hydrolase [Bryobacteraceae bacterium]|jgi:HAD superfamily phosphatase|nr:HAD-IA family hydrolase [Bryobacteraceae bacterium]